MKKAFIKLFFSILIVILFTACNDPVFYYISQEPPKVEPKIKGASANFVKNSAGDIYTASGSRLYKYAGDNPVWTESFIVNQSSGINRPWIRQLAITDKYLYAVCDDRNNNIFIVKADLTAANASQINNLEWSPVNGIENTKIIQSIFAINDTLYISARNLEAIEEDLPEDIYSIYYLKDDDAVIPVDELDEVSQLVGAAFDGSAYYLCTKNGYYFSNSHDFPSSYNFNQILFSEGKPFAENKPSSDEFTGIIRLGNTSTIVAITRSGKLYKIISVKKDLDDKSDDDVIASFNDDRRANGALAIWSDGTDYLLLAGRQDINYSINTGYTYGYLEIEFNSSTGNLIEKVFHIPGEAGKPTTVLERSRYINSIGKNPVNHIIQAKDETLFASTQKNGVWSYRLRSGHMQWNAEE